MIKLHQAKLSDAFDVLHVLNSALALKRSYGDTAWGDGSFTASEILPYIENGELYIVLESGDVTGVVVLQETDENMWEAEGRDNKALYIHKLSSTQKGLGVKMLDAAERIAKKHSKLYLRLDCAYENSGLHGYYLKYGFGDVRQSTIEDAQVALMQKKL
jgi:hypothetical protein